MFGWGFIGGGEFEEVAEELLLHRRRPARVQVRYRGFIRIAVLFSPEFSLPSVSLFLIFIFNYINNLRSTSIYILNIKNFTRMKNLTNMRCDVITIQILNYFLI